MPIYTKKGDRGETSLPGGRRLNKSSKIFTALGAIDQTNSMIGLAVAFLDQERDRPMVDQLQTVQASLLGIGSSLANTSSDRKLIVATLTKLTVELERQIDRWDEALPPLKNFIIPGGEKAAAILHCVRTEVRAFERSYHDLDSIFQEQAISTYINRLSDYFFQATRYLNFINKREEIVWREN